MSCKNCGSVQAKNAPFCASCGAELIKPESSESLTIDNTNGFAKRLCRYGSSQMFLNGCILYTTGALLGFLLVFTPGSIITLPFLALPIIGIWKIYHASIKAENVTGFLSGITLLRIITIILLVFLSIMLGLVAITFLIGLVESLAAGDTFFFFGFLVLGGIFTVIFWAFIRFYFVALLRAFKSIREGLMQKTTDEIRGVGSFVVISYIILGIFILGNLYVLYSPDALNTAMQESLMLMDFGTEIMLESLPQITFMSTLLQLVSSVGMLFIIRVFHKFAISVRKEPIMLDNISTEV